MTDKLRFTEGRVSKLACPPGQYVARQVIYRDTETPGLGVRVTESGIRAYIFERRVHGHTVRTTIGDVRTWQLGAARAEARRLSTLVDRGEDPRHEARDKQAAHADMMARQRRSTVTLRDAWAAYIGAQKPRWGARHAKDHEEIVLKGRTLAPLLKYRLSEITAAVVAHWLGRQAEKRAAQAALAFRLLRAFANWADGEDDYRGLIAPDALTARKVRDKVPSTGTRTDVLQREMLRSWFAAVRARPEAVTSTYLQTLLLLGCRREEAAEVRWTDVDFTWATITLRDKIEGERTIGLPPYTARLLNSLPRVNDWVFATDSESGHIESPTKAHLKALKAAELPHLTLQGLRRSFKSLSEWCEMPVGIVAQIMGHKPSATAEKHYTVRPVDLLRLWHTKLEVWMLEQAGLAVLLPKDADESRQST
jgi:integrase